MPQRLIDSGFWSDPDPCIEEWSNDQRLAFLYLLTHPQSAPCGIWRVSPRETAMHLGLKTPEAARKLLATLEPKAYFDAATCYVCIPAYPKWQCKNPKTAKPAAETLRTLPSPVVAWLSSERLVIPYQVIRDTVSIRYVYHPDTEPEPDPVTEPDRSAGSAVAPAKSARPARARPKPRRPAGDWTPPPPREDPDFETAVRIHQKTLAELKQDVPPRAAYGNPPDEPRKARGLAVEVMIIQDLLPAYSEERLSRVAEGALLDDWTTERRAYDIKRLFAPSKARQFIDLAENGVPSKVGNLL